MAMETRGMNAFKGDLEQNLKGTFDYNKMPPDEAIKLLWDQSPESVKEFYRGALDYDPPECLQIGDQENCAIYLTCEYWGKCVKSYIDRVAAGLTWEV